MEIIIIKCFISQPPLQMQGESGPQMLGDRDTLSTEQELDLATFILSTILNMATFIQPTIHNWKPLSLLDNPTNGV